MRLGGKWEQSRGSARNQRFSGGRKPCAAVRKNRETRRKQSMPQKQSPPQKSSPHSATAWPDGEAPSSELTQQNQGVHTSPSPLASLHSKPTTQVQEAPAKPTEHRSVSTKPAQDTNPSGTHYLRKAQPK